MGGTAVPNGYLPIGERIRHRRRARGLSQLRLAGLVDRTEDWVSKVERGEIPVDRISVLVRVADALKVPLSDLLGEQNWSEEQTASPQETAGLRRVLSTLPGTARAVPRAVSELEADLLSATRLRAQARYAAAAAALPGLITDLEVAAEANEGDDRNKALGLLARAYGLAVATLVRYNEHDLAWVAADRGIYAAEPTGDPIERALSAYRVAQARKGDQARAQEALREAEGLSRGPDGRFQMAPDLQLATQFCPANVAAHQVSVAVDLGDAGQALVVAPRVDQAELSISRYSRHLIDVALAHNYRRDTPGMVTTLLDVEQLAPEQLSHFPLVREMLHAALRRERGPMNRHLHRLAERIGAF